MASELSSYSIILLLFVCSRLKVIKQGLSSCCSLKLFARSLATSLRVVKGIGSRTHEHTPISSFPGVLAPGGALDRALPLLRLVSFPVGVTGEDVLRALGLVGVAVCN